MKTDIFGEALQDYFEKRFQSSLILHNSYGDDEEMPLDIFFRDPEDFPELEFIALALCDGKVLDVGAGAGSHTLYLQEKGFDVTALELSPQACHIMKRRGVKKVLNCNIFNYVGGKYDTLLFLMNGIGLAENIEGLKKLLVQCKKLLKKGGQLIFDSSNIAYLYEEDLLRPDHYYGEVTFQYEYKEEQGTQFGWLYIDQESLIKIAQQSGWVVQILYEDENDQYLTRLSLKD